MPICMPLEIIKFCRNFTFRILKKSYTLKHPKNVLKYPNQ